MLSNPLPSAAENRLRCALSSVLCAAGKPQDAADQAQLVLAQPDLPADLRDRALTARLQALAGLRDKLAGPAADAVLAGSGQPGGSVTAAALVTRAVVAWDDGQVSDALDLLREAARRDGGISADARDTQPMLALAAALIDLRQLTEADSILRAADRPALQGIPARAGLAILRARAHLAAGRLTDAADDGHAALGIAEGTGARGYAATAHSVLAMIELRRGDIAVAAQHLACRPTASPIVQTTGARGYAATAHSVPSVVEPRGDDPAAPAQHLIGRPAASPQFTDLYARRETTLAEARIIEARDGAAAALGHIFRLCEDLRARPGLLLGDPALAAWLVCTALAAGDSELAADVGHSAESLAAGNPGFPALAAAAAHSRGLASQDPARIAEAAARHPDPWARASAAEDLGVLCDGQGDRERAICHLKEALAGYRQVGADRDQARIRRRLRQLGIRRRHWATQAGPSPGGAA